MKSEPNSQNGKESGDLDRLKEAIRFVSQYCSDKPMFGTPHLNKILYWADHLYFKITGVTITRVEFQKLEHGPAPRQIVTARNELIKEGKLEIELSKVFANYPYKRPTNIGELRKEYFDQLEQSMLRSTSDAICNVKPVIVSDLSHDLNWAFAGLNETIPSFTIHTTRVNPITDSTKVWVNTLVEKRGLAVKTGK